MSTTALSSGVAQPGLLRRGLAHPRVIVCLGYLVLLACWTPLGLPLPHDPDATDSGATLMAPSREHLFGTDQYGYDIFSRSILAAYNDLTIAAAGTLLAAVLGTVLGVVWSRGGFISETAMRVIDLWQSLPLLAIAITLVGLTGGGSTMLLVIIVGFVTPVFIRLVRAESLLLRKRGYVLVARSYGASESRVLWRHLIPNCSTAIFPQFSLSLGLAIVMISSLGFLGLGQAGTASWGSMLQSGISLMLTGQWWITTFPALMIFTVVLAASEASVAIQRLVERPSTRSVR